MKKLFFVFALLCLLAACGQPTQTPTTFTQENPLVTQTLSVFETQKIPSIFPGNGFGFSVGIDGDLMVVGEPHLIDFKGAAYILQRHGPGEWRIEAILLASDGTANDLFGSAVSISGDTVVVGASNEEHGTNCDTTSRFFPGAGYIFQRNQGGSNQWGQVRKIVGEGFCFEWFGEAVDIAGDTVVVGATGSTGQAYIFMRNAGGTSAWGRTKKLLPGDFASGFGKSVSVSFDTVVVGTEPANAAYIFLRNQGGTGNWGQVKKLVPNDVIPGNRSNFGSAVAVSVNTIVVGDLGQTIDINNNGVLECDDSSDECAVGAAYVFERNQGGTEAWGQVKKLLASDWRGLTNLVGLLLFGETCWS